MGALVPFAYGDALVRVIEIDAAPWWVASDVAKVLGYRIAPDMVRNLDDDEADTHIVRIRSENGVVQDREVTIISESGLYHAILKSRRPEAKRFRKWVTSEVLPAIRRHGFYEAPQAPAPQSEPALPSYSWHRGRRSRLSSIDKLAGRCGEAVAWAKAALRERSVSQVEIHAEFNRRIIAKGEKPVSKSAFSRFAIHHAVEIQRLEEELMITREMLSRMGPDEQFDALHAAAQVIRSRLIDDVNSGSLDARQNQLAALALERLSGVIERGAKSRKTRPH
ncbi:BRO family protein [Sphingobium cloacae]|uniref:BRO family protein n=1 Tax=Sphingobium cloacae TaxID=120107 RepID=A0A1E1F2R5_9SPHN|nr:BRO family protein [Sphingobium cloacae]BAV64796.1 BRO family protein [Sphingobium cloacae]